MQFVKHLECLHCGRTYKAEPTRYTCPECDIFGILNVVYDYEAIGRAFSPAAIDASNDPTLWRFLPLLPVDPDVPAPPCAMAAPPCSRRPGWRRTLAWARSG